MKYLNWNNKAKHANKFKGTALTSGPRLPIHSIINIASLTRSESLLKWLGPWFIHLGEILQLVCSIVLGICCINECQAKELVHATATGSAETHLQHKINVNKAETKWIRNILQHCNSECKNTFMMLGASWLSCVPFYNFVCVPAPSINMTCDIILWCRHE